MKTFAHNPFVRIAHKSIACILIFCVVNMPVWALDFNSSIGTSDPAGITGGTGVDVLQNRAIIDWNNMNTVSGELLRFQQEGGGNLTSSFAVLNRIAGDATRFDGILQGGQGHIFMINPQGIILGSTAKINAGRFTASTLDISNSNFMNGVYKFTGDGIGKVENYAVIDDVTEQVMLLGKTVLNEGTIIVPEGTVIMAAGDDILITQDGSNVAVKLEIPKIAADYDVTHGDGYIRAQHVIVMAAGDIWARAAIDAYDDASSNAVASVDIDALGDVTITDKIRARAVGDSINKATVTVDAGGDVKVSANEGSAGLYAEARNGVNNTAEVDMLANNVLVLAQNGDYARIQAMAQSESVEAKNSAAVNIETFTVAVDEGSAEPQELQMLSGGGLDDIGVFCDLLDAGGHVVVAAMNGGYAQVEALTSAGDSHTTNNSDVLICAEGIVATGAFSCNESWTNAEIKAWAYNGYENNASVGIGAQQGLASLALGYNAKAKIASQAVSGYTNTADLVACTGGPAVVFAHEGGISQIKSEAYKGQHNTASTGVCADSLVAVVAACEEQTSVAEIYSKATGINGSDYEPPTADAKTVVVSKNSGVAVVAMEEGQAGIWSKATDAANTNAYTGVCAEDHVIVAAGIENMIGEISPDGGSGGRAYISSYARSYTPYHASKVDGIEQQEPIESDPFTSNAETAVISHKGSVAVVDITGCGVGSAIIYSSAYGGDIATAYTGVAAGADLSPASLDDEVEPEEPETFLEYIEYLYRYGGNELLGGPGNVVVYAEGPDSDAWILSEARNGLENTADTVVCAPGEVSVESNGPGSLAKIKSYAIYGETNTAMTQVYANSVRVAGERGRIRAYAQGSDNLTVNPYFEWMGAEDEPVLMIGDGEASTLIVDSYANKQDCPDCPPCPDCPCDDRPVPIPVAPLQLLEYPVLSGCPTEMEAAAAELAVNSDTLQMMINSAMASNPNLQPCEACASLLTAAATLKQMENSRHVAALAQIFDTLAPIDAPFTPEVSASVKTALANFQEMETQLAMLTDEEYQVYQQSAMANELVEAFVSYVAVLENDLKLPVGDAVALVMDKYGDAIDATGNPNIGAYLIEQIEATRDTGYVADASL